MSVALIPRGNKKLMNKIDLYLYLSIYLSIYLCLPVCLSVYLYNQIETTLFDFNC